MSDSRSGRLALYLAVLGGLLLLLGPAAYRFEVVDLLPSLAGVALGVFICVVGLMAGVMSGASSRHSPAAAQRARIGALCSALLLAYPVWVIVQSRGTPAIHHITTDPDDPPQFEELPPLRGVRANPLDYPGEEVATMQREAYPDVVPLRLSTPPSDAFASALDAALELGWDVVAADGEAGRIEATERTLIFGFTDDIVVRIRAEADGSRVDLRSVSRVGVGDLGVNAARVHAFLQSIEARVDGLPADVSRAGGS